MEQLINICWVFLGAVMVMLMQAGFCYFGSGLNSAKKLQQCFNEKILWTLQLDQLYF